MPDRSSNALSGRAELLVQSVTDYAIYMLDADGVIVTWNAGAERFKGYTADEIVGEHFSRFYTEEDKRAGAPANALAKAARDGHFEAEGWRVRKDGTRFWANVVIDPIRDEQGDLIGFAKITRDLTERRQAEDELRKSEERFRLLVQGVRDYAIYMLDPEGRVTSWNAGAERFKGYEAHEIIGEHFSRFYTPEDVAIGKPALALRTAVEAGHFEAEGWRVRKDGTRFWASVALDPIRNTDGTLIGFAKITRDLTERREAQLALERTQEAFFQSQKLEAIGKLTGGVAHDFNNILSAILGSLDLAERRLMRGEDVTEFLSNARMAADRGATLTQRMLSFARKQELKLEAVDVVRTVRGMSDLLIRSIGPGISIDTSFPLALPLVRADPTQLELALLNLVVNARDAMPEGGLISIGARVRNGATSGERFVCLFVRDAGVGMDADTLRQAVEPFFTTKGVGKGTGLGLSMVQGMAEQIGGSFDLRSVEGEGTTAEICLPEDTEVQAPAPRASTPSPSPGQDPQAPRLTVLAVDDDAIILLNTVLMLEDLGHTVHQAISGRDALSILESHAFDLLITDYAMPGMTGGELVEKARAQNPTLPVIIVSGYAELPHGHVLAASRLPKPFSEAQLARAIDELELDGTR